MGVMATFIQRAYDQLSHDVALNNLPALFVDFCGGAMGGLTDMTHLGFFDIAMISNIPNILFLAPATVEEYISMVDWAVDEAQQPVFVRTPAGEVIHTDRPVDMDFTNRIRLGYRHHCRRTYATDGGQSGRAPALKGD